MRERDFRWTNKGMWLSESAQKNGVCCFGKVKIELCHLREKHINIY